jgi:hypothetical protein
MKRIFYNLFFILLFAGQGFAQPLIYPQDFPLSVDFATTAPTINDDEGDGYKVGSRWQDVTANEEYVCLDATAGAAIWTKTTATEGSEISADTTNFDHALTSADDTVQKALDTLDDAGVRELAKVNEVGGITIGQAVYVSDASGEKSEASLADNTVHDKAHVLGIAIETKADGQNIRVMMLGQINGVDTSMFSAGDRLHLSTSGNLQVAVPTSGAHIHMGFVVKSDATDGIILCVPEVYVHDIRGVDDKQAEIACGDDDSTGYVDFQDYSRNINGRFDGTGLFTWNWRNTSTADFNIKGDNNNNMFYADVSADGLGLGTNTPGSRLEINSATASQIGLILQSTDDDTTNDIFKTQDSGGTDIITIDPTGYTLFDLPENSAVNNGFQINIDHTASTRKRTTFYRLNLTQSGTNTERQQCTSNRLDIKATDTADYTNADGLQAFDNSIIMIAGTTGTVTSATLNLSLLQNTSAKDITTASGHIINLTNNNGGTITTWNGIKHQTVGSRGVVTNTYFLNSDFGENILAIDTATHTPLTLKGAASQSASYFLVTDVSSNVGFEIDADFDVIVGSGAVGKDYSIIIDGETNNGLFIWMEDEDYFQFSDDILLLDNEQLKLGTGNDFKLYHNSTNSILENDTGEIRIGSDGGTTNYSAFESDGTLEFNGTATVFDDLRIPGLSVKLGASAPDLAAFLGAGNLLVLRFDGGATTEQVYFTVQLPHSYKEGSNITPHVHWSAVDGNAGNVHWQLEYTWQNIDGTFPAVTTITATDATSGTAWDHQKAAFSAITGTGKTISSMLVCRLFRDPTDGADTYGSDAAFLEFDFHFELDTVGSRTINDSK